MQQLPMWNWDSQECLRRFFILFETLDSTEKVSKQLIKEYQGAPTRHSMGSRILGSPLRVRLVDMFGEQRVIDAYAAYHGRASKSIRGIVVTRRDKVARWLTPLTPEEEMYANFWARATGLST